MGYTHYWNVRRDADRTKLLEARDDMWRIIAASPVPLVGWDGTGKPGLSPNVRFNGVGEDAHETFSWPPDLSDKQEFLGAARDEVFTFCKTARKPYDVVVVACLLRAQAVLGDAIRVSSDASDFVEFAGTEVSEGWQSVNAMLGHPTEHGSEENAVQLYESVFGEPPPIPRCFAERVDA